MTTSSFKTDLYAVGKVTGRRFEGKAVEQNLSAPLQLQAASAVELYSLSGDATNYPILPDATTLTLGAKFEFFNKDGGTFPVKAYDATTPVTLFSIAPDEYYTVVCVDNTSAAGGWHVIKETSGDVAPTPKYIATFNATVGWTQVGSDYIRTILAATHGMGTTPSPEAYEDISGVFRKVGAGLDVNASGDVILTVNALPDDGRFGGRVVIV